jgi:drug/metabolite transporter (DMT)-like permease
MFPDLHPEFAGSRKGASIMSLLGIIIAVIAVALLLTGGFVQSLNFLLWVGIVLLVLAAIVWLVRFLTGRRSV